MHYAALVDGLAPAGASVVPLAANRPVKPSHNAVPAKLRDGKE